MFARFRCGMSVASTGNLDSFEDEESCGHRTIYYNDKIMMLLIVNNIIYNKL